MSASSERGGAGPDGPRRVVASFSSYAEAERAVDFLSDRKFPVEHIAIVGRDLRLVEQVTGRVGNVEAAVRGAGTGAFIGAIFGAFFGLFDALEPLISGLLLALYGLVFGAIVGAVLGLLLHAAMGGRRDFASVGAMRADRYELLVDADRAAEASRMLAELESGVPAAGPPPAGAST